MKKICFFVFILYFSMPLLCQEVILSGVVFDNKKELLPNVNIILRDRRINKVIAFGITKEQGIFNIKVAKEKILNTTISFSYIGFQTVTKELSGSDQKFEIIMNPEAISIKEVNIKAPKIRAQGDTLVYNIASYAQDYDKTIGDVLKKLPGIQVQENGQIRFNGEPINKFYIEGSDLLEGKYGIATNSISSKDVSVVEVLQDHQPVRALEGLNFSDKTAINIKLKEDAKYKWVGTMQGGIGFEPLLWNAQLTAMRFTKKLQTINTYKTNNTGTDVTKEFTSFDLNVIKNRKYDLPNYITVSSPVSMGLDRNRELFNRTHQLTTNNLTKLKGDIELKINSSYMDHRETGKSSNEIIYYESNGDTTLVLENESSGFYKKNFTAGLVLEANKPTYTLTNKLNASMNWVDGKANLTGTYPSRQKSQSPHHQLSNNLYLLKRFGKKFVTFESFTTYQNHPQQLSVLRSSESQFQDIHLSGFSSNNKAGYGFVLGKLVTSFTTGISVSQKKLSTQLKGTGISETDLSGDTKFTYAHSYLIPKFEFRLGSLKSVLSVPVNYYNYVYKDDALNEKAKHNVFLFAPELYLSMDVTSRLKLSATGEISKTPVNERIFYSGVMLTDYRSLISGLPEFVHATRKTFSGSISYKQPLNELFSSLTLTRSWNEQPYTMTQSFLDNYILSSYLPQKNKLKTWFLMAFFNKGIDIFRGYFFLNTSWLRNESLLVRNDSQLPNTRTSIAITPKVETNPVKWLVLTYSLSFAYNRLSLGNNSGNVTNSNINQSLFIRILPNSKWNVTVKGEHYYNEISETEKKHFLLMDASTSYRLCKRWELTLYVNNLLNRKTYSYRLFTNDATTVYQNYRIRPRNVLISAYCFF